MKRRYEGYDYIALSKQTRAEYTSALVRVVNAGYSVLVISDSDAYAASTISKLFGGKPIVIPDRMDYFSNPLLSDIVIYDIMSVKSTELIDAFFKCTSPSGRIIVTKSAATIPLKYFRKPYIDAISDWEKMHHTTVEAYPKEGNVKAIEEPMTYKSVKPINWDDEEESFCFTKPASDVKDIYLKITKAKERSEKMPTDSMTKSPSLVKRAFEEGKRNAVDGVWMTAADETVQLFRAPTVTYIKKKFGPMPAGIFKTLVDTEVGEGVFALLLGTAMGAVGVVLPKKVAEDPRYQRLGEEIRVFGFYKASRSVVELVTVPMRKKLTDIVLNLPEVSSDDVL